MKVLGGFKKFLQKNRDKSGDFGVLEKDKTDIKNLLIAEQAHMKELRSIDDKILQIQHSTKTNIPWLAPVHNYLRMRWQWYYRWHMNPWSSRIHATILLAVIMSASFFSTYPRFQERALAADNTWTGASNNWSNAASWTLGHAPTDTETAVISSAVTIHIDATANVIGITQSTGTLIQDIGVALTIGSSGYTQTGGTFTGGNSAITNAGDFTLSGGVFTSTSGTLSVAGNWSQTDGAFLHNSGTVDFTKSSGTQTLAAGYTPFYNMTHSGAGTLQNNTPSWQYNRLITIDRTKFTDVADPSTTYANFPVLISLSSLSNINASGTDIRFTDANGVPLAREIESYSAGALVAWVKFTPTKDAGDSTNDTLYMYYGNSGAVEPATTFVYGRNSVWNNSYAAIYHLGDGSTLSTVDSSGNQSDATNYRSAAASGEISGAAGFGSTYSAYIDAGNNASLNLTSNWTYGAWVKRVAASGTDIIVSHWASSSSQRQILIYIDTTTWGNKLVVDIPWVKAVFQSTFTIADTGWHYVAVTKSGNVWTAYKDGTAGGSATDATAQESATTATMQFGGSTANTTYGNLSIDEHRTSSVARSAQWITAEYNNQSSPSTFATAGSETASWVNVAGSLNVSGGTLNLNGKNLTVTGTLTVANGVNLTLTGDETVMTGTTTLSAGSTVEYTATSGTRAIKNWTYSSLKINGSGGTFNLPATITMGGTLTLAAGTLDATASNYNINLGGNWTKTSGAFTARSGTVTFTGSPTITGATSFYNFTATTADQALSFNAGDEQTITGTWTVTGTSGHNVVLQRSGGAGVWSVNPTTTSITYATVSNSTNTRGTNVTATNSTDGGGNTAWTITAPFTISGTCQKYDRTTNCADSETIAVAVNGSIQTGKTASTSSGAFTISGVTTPSTNDIITVFIDGVADALEANAVAKYDGSGNISGITLYEDHLTIGSADNQTISNSDLANYDNSVAAADVKENIFFEVDASNDLSTDATNQTAQDTLLILANNTYRPDSASSGNVGTTNLIINSSGTITADGNTFTLPGNWTNSGTFTANTSTVVINGSGTSTFTGNTTFNSLTCASAGKQLTFTAGSSQTVGGVLTLTGTYDNMILLRSSSAGSAWTIVKNGTTSIDWVDVQDSTATNAITATDGTNTSGNTNWTFTYENRYWIAGTTQNLNSTSYWSATSGGASGASVPTTGNNVFFNGSGLGSCTLNVSRTMQGIYSLSGYSGTLGTSSTYAFTVNGNVVWNAGTYTLATASTMSGSVTLGGTGTLNLNHAQAIGNASLVINGGTLNNTTNGTITLSTVNAQTWNSSFTFGGFRNLNLGTGAVTLTSDITVTSNTVNYSVLTVGGIISGNYNLVKAGEGHFALSGANTFGGSGKSVTLNAGTLNINGATALGDAANTFIINGGTIDNLAASNVTLTNNYPMQWNTSFTYTGTKALVFGSGAVTLGSDCTITLSSASYGLTVGGIISGSHNLTKAGTGSLTLSGANDFVGNVTLNAGTLNINNAIALGNAANTLIINGGTIDNSTAGSITLANNYPMQWNASFAVTGTSTLIFGSGAVTLGADCTITKNGAIYGLTVGGIISGNHNLTKAGSGSLVLNGANDFAGTVTVNAGSLYLPGANSFTGNITLNAGTLYINNAAALGNVANTLTINGGTLSNSGSTVTVSNANPIVINASFTSSALSGSNLTFSTSPVSLGANTTITSSTTTLTFGGVVSGSYSLTKAGTGGLTLSGANTFDGGTTIGAGTLTFSNGSLGTTGNITFTGGTLTYASGNTQDISARIKNSSSAIKPSVPAATTVVYASIIDSSNTGGLTQSGAGALTLNAANTYTGTTTVSAGTLNLGNATAIGTGTLSVATGSTLNNTSGAPMTLSNNNPVVIGGSFTFTGTNDLNLGTGAVTLSGNYSITVSAGVLTVGGVIDDGASSYTLSKDGTGTLTLNGANTFEGGVKHYQGILKIGHAQALGTGTFNIVNGNVTIDNSSGASMTLANNNALTFSTGNSLIFTGTNDLDFGNGVVTITPSLGGFTVNSNTLKIGGVISGAKALSKSGNGALTLSGINTFSNGVTLSAGTLNINNASAIGTGTFTITGGTIDNTSGAPITLSTNNVQAWNTDFAFTGTNNLNLGTGVPTLSASRIVTVNGGSLTVGGALAGSTARTLTKNGNGTLVIGASPGALGAWTINAGTIQMTAPLTMNNTGQDLAITSGTLDLNGQDLTINDLFTIGATGVLKMTGDETLNKAPTTITSGANVEYHATSGTRDIKNWDYSNATLWINGSGGTFTLPTNLSARGIDIDNGTLTQSSTYTVTAGTLGFDISNGNFGGGSGTVDINGNLALAGGTFTSTSGTLQVSGNWTKTSGNFTHNSGTVLLDGATSTISGSTTFNNFTTTTQDQALSFNAGDTQTIAGTWTVTGAAAHLVTLARSGGSGQWNVLPQGTVNISYANVSNSNNTGTTITPTNSVDGGGNTGWFTTAPTVTTQSASSLATTSATANGNITATGGVNATARGFKYGLTEADTWNSYDTADYGTGAFTKSITGLSPNTTYHIRAYATNSVGTSYGSYVAFTTLAATPSVSVAGDYSVADGYHLDATINVNDNPGGTNYYLQYSTNGTDFVDPNAMAWQTGTSYVFKKTSANADLSPDTQYWLKVKAKNSDNTETVYSSAVADVTPPAAPASPSLSNLCSTTVTLTWTAAPDANTYTVSYGTDTNGTNLGTIASIATTSKAMTGLSNATTYYWKVSATSTANGTGAYSSTETFATTTCLAPTAPSDFNGSPASTTQINWSWTDSADNETAYRVKDADGANISASLPAGSTSYNETSLSANTAYSRKVNVSNAIDNSNSNLATVYTLANTPSAPTVAVVSSSSLKITINQNSNPAATRYAIYNQTLSKYVKNSDGTTQDAEDWQLYVDWNGASGFVNSGLTPNTSYTYKVKAKNGDNTETAFSSTSVASTLHRYTVTINSDGNGSGIFDQSSRLVDENSNLTTVATSATSSNFIAWTGCDSTSTTSCTLTNITSDKTITATFTLKTYTITISKSGTGDGTFDQSSGSVNYGTNLTTIATPVASSNFTAWTGCDSTDSASCTLSNITQNHTITAAFTLKTLAITVVKAGTGEGTFSQASGTVNYGADFSTITTADSSSYFVIWSGCDTADGATCNLTNTTVDKTITATLNLKPTISAGVTGGSKTNQSTISLSVTANSVATQMQISNSSGFTGAEWESVASTKSWTLLNPTIDGTKTIYLKAKDSSGIESAISSASTTLDTTAPSAPTALTATSGNSSISLSWTNPTDSDFANIAIFRSTTKDFISDLATNKIGNTTSSSTATYVDTTAENNTTYYYAIKALDDADNYSTASAQVLGKSDSDNPTTPGVATIAEKVSSSTCHPELDSGSINAKTGSLVVARDDTIAGNVPCEIVNKKDITLSWAKSTDENSGLKAYYLYVGSKSGESDITNAQEILASADSGSVSSIMYHVSGDGTYYVRVQAKDNLGNSSAVSPELAFIIDTTAPTLSSDKIKMYDASDRANGIYAVILSWLKADESGSGLKGYVVSRGTTLLSIVNGVTSNIQSSADGNTLYYFDQLSADQSASYSVLAIDNATNQSTPSTAKLAKTETITATGQAENSTTIKLTSSIIGEGKLELAEIKATPSEFAGKKTQATITWKSTVPATSEVQYGINVPVGSSGYALMTPTDTGLNSSHTAILTDLTPNTTYHFQVASKDKHGTEIKSEDQTFTTNQEIKQQSVLDIIIQNITSVFGNLWNSIKGIFSYGQKGALSALAADNQTIAKLSVINISTPDKLGYALYWPTGKGVITIERKEGDGQFGQLVTTDKNFYLDYAVKDNTQYSYRIDQLTATSSDSLSGKPTISSIKIESGLSTNDEASLIITFKTDTLSTAQVNYGETTTYGLQTTRDEALNQSHTILIEKLKPNATYHLQITAGDKSGTNNVVTEDQVATTALAPAQENILEIVAKYLQQAFSGFDGWMKK